eukprot:767186-Hanusia_phi.AAC.3
MIISTSSLFLYIRCSVFCPLFALETCFSFCFLQPATRLDKEQRKLAAQERLQERRLKRGKQKSKKKLGKLRKTSSGGTRRARRTGEQSSTSDLTHCIALIAPPRSKSKAMILQQEVEIDVGGGREERNFNGKAQRFDAPSFCTPSVTSRVQFVSQRLPLINVNEFRNDRGRSQLEGPTSSRLAAIFLLVLMTMPEQGTRRYAV